MLTTPEDRRVGLEQELFLVDEDGVLSNRADEFLTRWRGGPSALCFSFEEPDRDGENA